MYLFALCAWCLWRPEEGMGSLGTGVRDVCEPPCGCWALNASPVLEHRLLFPAEPSLQPQEQISTEYNGRLKCKAGSHREGTIYTHSEQNHLVLGTSGCPC